MPVRQTYQMNAPSGNNGGLILGEPLDVKGRRLAGGLPWIMDLDVTNRVRLGDTVAGGRSGISVPTVPYGGFGLVARNASGVVTVTPDDAVIRLDTTGGPATVNLPAVATMADQFLDIILSTTGGTANGFTVVPAGGDLINFQTSLSFGQFESAIRIRSNGSMWEVFKDELRLRALIEEDNPAGTSTGALAVVGTSASFYYSGRPVMFLLTTAGFDNAGADEFMQAEFTIRIDAGAENRICQWDADRRNDHRMVSGFRVLTPGQGSHQVFVSIRRTTGAGTFTLDFNDWVRLYSIEL